MAKLFFNFSAMNAGKSTILLQASHNYIERGMATMLMTASLDTRHGSGVDTGVIKSRIGISAEAEKFNAEDDVKAMVAKHHARARIDAVLVDEAQFLTKEQVWQLAGVVDELNIPVLCYGLRTDFRGELFAGSATLLALADEIREIRTICWCGKKAIMVVRIDAHGNPVEDGEQIVIGGNERYASLCRKHWLSRQLAPDASLKD